MTQEKSAELKLRIAPSEKAQWQAAAAEEGISVSEYVRRAVNAFVSQSTQPIRVGDILHVTETNEVIDTERALKAISGGDIVDPTVRAAQWYGDEPTVLTHIPIVATDEAVDVPVAAAQSEDVGTSDAAAGLTSCEKQCKPWEFCACKGAA